MGPASNRFGPTLASAPFSHLQQSNLPSHNSQHQPSNSGGLPPPSYNHGFGQGNPSNINPFAPTGNLNGLAGGFGPGGGLSAGGTGLASREAVLGFQHGAQLQLQQQARDQIRRGSGGVGPSKNQMKSRIRDVWRGNLHQELRILRDLVDRYPYISMVIEPVSDFVPLFSLQRLEWSPLMMIGYRVPRYRGPAYGCIHYKSRLPLPNPSLQCRPTKGHSTRYHTVQ